MKFRVQCNPVPELRTLDPDSAPVHLLYGAVTVISEIKNWGEKEKFNFASNFKMKILVENDENINDNINNNYKSNDDINNNKSTVEKHSLNYIVRVLHVEHVLAPYSLSGVKRERDESLTTTSYTSDTTSYTSDTTSFISDTTSSHSLIIWVTDLSSDVMPLSVYAENNNYNDTNENTNRNRNDEKIKYYSDQKNCTNNDCEQRKLNSVMKIQVPIPATLSSFFKKYLTTRISPSSPSSSSSSSTSFSTSSSSSSTSFSTSSTSAPSIQTLLPPTLISLLSVLPGHVLFFSGLSPLKFYPIEKIPSQSPSQSQLPPEILFFLSSNKCDICSKKNDFHDFENRKKSENCFIGDDNRNQKNFTFEEKKRDFRTFNFLLPVTCEEKNPSSDTERTTTSSMKENNEVVINSSLINISLLLALSCSPSILSLK